LTDSLFPYKVMYHIVLYSVRGLERSELGGSHGCPGRLWDRFYDRSILRSKHRAYYRSGRPVIKIGPKGALGSDEIPPIHSAPSLGQSIAKCYRYVIHNFMWLKKGVRLQFNGPSMWPTSRAKCLPDPQQQPHPVLGYLALHTALI